MYSRQSGTLWWFSTLDSGNRADLRNHLRGSGLNLCWSTKTPQASQCRREKKGRNREKIKPTYKQKEEQIDKTPQKMVKATLIRQEHTKKLTLTQRKKQEKNKREPEKKGPVKSINKSINENKH